MGSREIRHLALFCTASAAITAAGGLVGHRILGSAGGLATALILAGAVGVVSILVVPRLVASRPEWDAADGIESARLRVMARLSLGIAHDLRAPINAINLNLANLKHALGEFDEATFRSLQHVETIEMLEQELERLKRAIESVLGQTGPMGAATKTFAVGELIEELEFLLRAQARQLRVDLKIATDPGLPLVQAPRDWIKQAILNLVVNAFDATREGGRVAIEARPVDDRAVEVVVSDTGSGIPSAMVSEIFHIRVSGKKSGTGIGLYTARAAVESSGGSLELLHTGSSGTSFVIRLPAAGGGVVGQQA